MNYQKVTLTFPAENLSGIAERLSLSGFSSYELEDYSDLCSESSRRFYDYIDEELLRRQSEDPKIRYYFEATPQGNEELAQLVALLREPGFESVRCIIEEKDDSEWRDRWKEYFKPFAVGKRLFVYPPWEENVRIPEGRTGLVMDPSAAFGSGTHATTALCMECAEDYLVKDACVLDLGCGSGILALSALKLGAGRADCADVEESAVRVTLENARLNGILPGRLRAKCADVTRGALFGLPYDLIFANLVSSLLIELADEFPKHLKPSGVLIASGILAQRKDETQKALESAGLKTIDERFREEWYTLVLKRNR